MNNNSTFKNTLISRAFNLSKNIILLSDKFSNKKSSSIITGQLIRSGTSIAANIIEAQAASSRKDFVNFLNHSLKSGNETKFWLELIKEVETNLTDEINILLMETDEIVKILASSIIKLRKTDK